jgi:exodeoxyribonuclease VII small subunit
VILLSTHKTFESSLQALEAAVERLEKGDLPLEEALSCFEEGVKAAGSCQKLLKEAELKIEKLLIDDAGELKSEPFVEGTRE